MDTKSLTLLVEILDAGNLSEAARRLKMTRANVSYHLSQLERSVGMQLVRRSTRRVEATEIGLRLYQHGRSIQDELVAARESVQSLGKTPQGKVRLSVPSGYGQFVMTPWLLEFKRDYPDIVLDVLFENSVEDLLRDEVDIAVRIMSEPPQNLVARELGQVRYVACASRAYAEARGCPRCPRTWRAARHQRGRHRPAAAAVGLLRRPAKAACGAGAHGGLAQLRLPARRHARRPGVGIVPDYVVHEDVARGDLVQALPDWRLSIFGRTMYMLYMPNRHHPRAIAMMIEYILRRAQVAHDGQPGLLGVSG